MLLKARIFIDHKVVSPQFSHHYGYSAQCTYPIARPTFYIPHRSLRGILAVRPFYPTKWTVLDRDPHQWAPIAE